jgi:hypothetical protein
MWQTRPTQGLCNGQQKLAVCSSIRWRLQLDYLALIVGRRSKAYDPANDMSFGLLRPKTKSFWEMTSMEMKVRRQKCKFPREG